MWFQPKIRTSCECRQDFWRLIIIGFFGLFLPGWWFVQYLLSLFTLTPLPFLENMELSLLGSLLIILFALFRISRQIQMLCQFSGPDICLRLARKAMLVTTLFFQLVAWTCILLWVRLSISTVWIPPVTASAFMTSFWFVLFIFYTYTARPTSEGAY